MILVFCLSALLAASEEASGPTVPLVGRPDEFSGASGRFDLDMEVEPEQVPADDPCVLRVFITAVGPVLAPPERLVPSELLLADFHVEELGIFPSLNETARAVALFGLGAFAPTPLGTLPGLMPTRSWEFRYRLRPKRRDVTEVPGFALCFHDPHLHTASRAFMTAYADPLPIIVLPPTNLVVPLVGPDSLFTWLSGDELRAVREPPGLPGSLVLAGLLALPVFGCVVWFCVWRRLYPDAAHQASLRRSRAASRALHDLERGPRRPTRVHASHVAAVLSRYLRERFEQPQTEPTPHEIAEHLTRRGLVRLADAARQVQTLLDAWRFGTPDTSEVELVAEVRSLILALENEPCPASG